MKHKLLNKLWLRVGMIVAVMTTALAGTAWADEVTMAYSGSTTTNMTGGNDAATVGLSATDWSVVGAKGSSNNFPGLNKDGSIRLYYNADGSNTITVSSLNNYTISSITVTYKNNYSNGTITVGGNVVTGTGSGTEKTYSIDATSFVIGNGNSSNVQVHIVSVVINYTTGGTPTPSISADNVDIEYNATSGSIAYSLTNGVSDGVVTAATTSDWLSVGTVASSSVPFTCSANTTKVDRTATVTLTYTYNTSETVTKNVTVTQAGNPNIVDNIEDITAAGTYAVQGTIVAKSQRGFIVGDGTGYVYYYNQNYAQSDYNIGDKVKLAGSVVVYGGVYEFNNSTTVTTVTESNYVAEEPTVLTGAQMDARVASTTPAQLSSYVEYQGTLTVSGTYYNITNIEGATTAKGSISFPISTDFTSLAGKTVKVKGYYVGISSSQYYNTLIGSVEEVVNANPVISASDVNIAYDATSGEIAYTIANPTDATLTATTSADWISDIVVTADKVTFTTTTNEGTTDRTATITLSYTGAENKVVTVTQGHYVADFATLPFEFDEGKADIENTAGLTQEGLDSDYGTSPKLKFNTTDDYLILKFNERPGKLTFDVKGNPSNGVWSGTFTVQTSEDGTTYTDLESYTELTSTAQSEEFNNLGEDVRYIKWIYTEKVSGNVALGNIKLAQYGTVAAATVNVGTLTNVTSVEMWDEDMNDIEDGDEVTAGMEVFVNPIAATGYTVESVIVVDADNNSVTVTANSGNWSFIMPNKSVTVSATATASSVTPIAGDKYVKVTSTADLTDGQYLIVCEDQNVAFDGGRDNDTNKLDAASNTISVTISNNEIAADATTNAAAFTIDMTNGTILSASGFYIGQTLDANGLQASDETEYENAISINEDGDADVVSSSAYLRYNAASNQTRFRYFKSSTYTGQKAIQLYKFVEAPTSQIVTVSDAGYATFVAEADLEIPAGVEVFAVTVNEAATSAHLEPITAGIPADEAVLVRASAGDYVFPYATEEVDPISDNDLQAATTDVTADGTQYCLANKTQGVGFYQVQSDLVIPAGKAYLVVEAPAGQAKTFYGFDDNATGLNNVDANVNLNEAIYNLAGQRLSKMQKGINIVNGKKILK